MKKYLLLLIPTILIVGLSSIAMAQTAPSATIGDVLMSLFGIVKSWSSLGLYGGIAALLKLLVDGLKVLGVWDKIPDNLKSVVVVLVGILTVGVTVLSSGGTVIQALAAALGSSGAAMLLHQLLDDLLSQIQKWLGNAGPAK